MMTGSSTRDVLKNFIHETVHNVGFVPCEVISRDDAALTCVCLPLNGIDNTYNDVMLQASPANGMILYPTVGSVVLVQPGQKDQAAYVAMVSACDKIKMLDGSYGGLTQVADLVTKLNNLENLVNDLVAKYNVHTHAGVTVGAAITAIPSVIESSTLTPTVRGDIENTKITHGTI